LIFHFQDPFDRLLIAQCIVEGLVLVTGDTNMKRYDVPVLDA
jgi:PIN domain nuclease of toxin-antitoxin system